MSEEATTSNRKRKGSNDLQAESVTAAEPPFAERSGEATCMTGIEESTASVGSPAMGPAAATVAAAAPAAATAATTTAAAAGPVAAGAPVAEGASALNGSGDLSPSSDTIDGDPITLYASSFATNVPNGTTANAGQFVKRAELTIEEFDDWYREGLSWPVEKEPGESSEQPERFIREVNDLLTDEDSLDQIRALSGISQESAQKLLNHLTSYQSDTHQGIGDAVSDSDQVANFASRLKSSFHSLVVKVVKRSADTLATIRTDLKAMAAFANKTEAETTGAAETGHEECSQEHYDEMMRGVIIQSPGKAEGVALKYLQGPGKTADGASGAQKGSSVAASAPTAVDKFAAFWNDLFEMAKFENKPKKNAINATASRILNWKEKSKKAKFTFPTDSSLEKDAVQPIVAALLRAVSFIGEDDEINAQGQDVAGATAVVQVRNEGDNEDDVLQGGESSARSEVRTERYIPKTRGTGTKRFVDCELNQIMAFNPYLLAHEMSLPVEVKNVARKARTPEGLHDEGVKQIAGHLAKRTLVAFDIGGVGIDLKSIGLVITPVYVEVLTMTLSGMGTVDALLEVERSGMLPLVSKKSMKAFVAEKHRDYLEKNCSFPRDNSVPAGMLELCRLLRSDDSALGLQFFNSPAQKATFKTYEASAPSWELGNVIGSGTHGVVQSIADNDSSVVKSSVVGEVRYIEREIRALQALARGSSKPRSIPDLTHFGSTIYDVRGASIRVPSAMISPRGSQVDGKLGPRLLKDLHTHISSALDFAHEKNVFHLDVCARNIIICERDGSIDEGNNVSPQFVLVDWGCSFCEGNNRPMGFRGSLPFAHLFVHGRENKAVWKPQPEHDSASLLFTICALHLGVPIPWSGFYKRNPDRACFDDRRKQTMACVEKLNYFKDDTGKRRDAVLRGSFHSLLANA